MDNRSPVNASNTITGILKILKDGEKVFSLSESRDVVLVLGNTGSGKTTLTSFITGDNVHLLSKETRPGSEEYILEDLRGKICSSTVNSCTLLPELSTDAATGVNFYDCPGFSDTRSAAHDIAATYFINKLISSADRVKIVCVVNYASVRSGGDRLDFPLLTKNIVTMIPNIMKFANSLSLVVTKVDNIEKRGKLIPDSVISSNIADFLKTVRDDFTQKLTSGGLSSSDILTYQSGVQFIDILLTKQGSIYSRIGLFRRPEQPGRVIDIPPLQEGKKYLRTIILDNTAYTPFAQGDFKYVIADKWKVKLQGLSGDINNLFLSEFQTLRDQIYKAYDKKRQKRDDFVEIFTASNSVYEQLTEFIKNRPAMEIEELIEKTLESCQNAKVLIPEVYIKNATELGQHVKFISFVSGLQLVNPSTVKKCLTDTMEFLAGEKQWYLFLGTLHEAVGSYSVQKNLARYSSDLTKREEESSEVERTFNSIVAGVAMDAGVPKLTRLYADVRNMTQDPEKLAVLDRVVMFLKSKIEFRCSEDTLLVMGYYMGLTGLLSKIDLCRSKIRHIMVWAMMKLFLDEDIEASGRNLQVTIIAPVWDVIGERRIIMDGLPGEQWSVKEGTKDGHGLNGQAGRAGGPSGSFFGIGQKCLKCEQLTISANGGTGGDGQDGGNGGNGTDGIRTIDWSWTTREESGDYATFVFDTVYTTDCEGKHNTTDNKIFRVTFHRDTPGEDLICKTRGGLGTTGGPAGVGGPGGFGGHHGQVEAIFMEPPDPRTNAVDGPRGKDGSSGQTGVDGEPGRQAEYQYSLNYLGVSTKQYLITHFVPQPGNYTKDSSSYAPERAQPAFSLSPSKLATNVNEYKTLARRILAQLPELGSESTLMQFLRAIETSNDVILLYDTLALVNDSETLENDLHLLQDKIPMMIWYNHLLSRIDQYIANGVEQNEEHKAVLRYLYASSLSTIATMNQQQISGSDWVINVEGFLESTIREIEKLTDFKRVIEKSKTTRKYRDGIDRKVKEALNLIQVNIIPDMEKAMRETNQSVEKLYEETQVQESIAQKEGENMLKIREQMKQHLMQKRILGAFQMVGIMMKVLGPVGHFVSAEIEVAGNNTGHKTSITPLPSEVKAALDVLQKEYDDEKLLLKEQCKELEHRCDSVINIGLDPSVLEILKKLKSKLAMTISKLDESKSEKVSIENDGFHLEEARNELKATFETAYLQLKDKPIESVTASQELIRHAISIFCIGLAGKDVYNMVKGSDHEIARLDRSIRNTYKKLEHLRRYEQTIHNNVKHLCEHIYTTLRKVVDRARTDTQAVLDVRKWKVQNALQRAQILLGEMTDGFKLQGQLMQSMEQLLYSVSSMIQLYDRIQAYRDQALLADYIAAISTKGHDLNVSNPELKSAIEELKLNIQTNLVLSEYTMAKNSVRQYVFPFAKKYLSPFVLPTKLKPGVNKAQLIPDVAHQLSEIEKNIKKDKYVLSQHLDGNKFVEVLFHRGGPLQAPFFTWTQQYNETISNFLSGQEVVLIADIRKGVAKNAIKFDQIGLQVHFADPLVQKQFDNQVKDFSVSMTHLGDSYYRCGEKFYVIDHNSQQIVHSMVEGREGKYPLANSVYSKIQNNYPIFSPYTAWKIQLKANTEKVEPLERFALHEAELDLVGRGHYISSQTDICDNLGDFYRLSDGISTSSKEPQQGSIHKQTSPVRRRRSVRDDYKLSEVGSWNTAKNNIFKIKDGFFSFFGLWNNTGQLSASWNNRDNRFDHEFTSLLPKADYKQETTIDGKIDYSALNFQTNLLAADYFVRRYMVPALTKTTKRSYVKENTHAHDLAYRNHVPKVTRESNNSGN